MGNGANPALVILTSLLVEGQHITSIVVANTLYVLHVLQHKSVGKDRKNQEIIESIRGHWFVMQPNHCFM
jgi:hypothetical protein